MLSHFLLMNLFALLVAVFFSLLWRFERRARIRLFLEIYLSMVGGGVLLAWLMFPFPAGPPTPLP